MKLLRYFFYCLAAFYALIFLVLAFMAWQAGLLKEVVENLFYAGLGASFGLAMERFISRMRKAKR